MASAALYGATVITFAPGRRNLSTLHVRLLLGGPLAQKDQQNGGTYKVIGTVAIAGTPDVMVERHVVLYDVRTRRPGRTVISSRDGAYAFYNVRLGPWFVVSFDHTAEYNAVIADNQYGIPM